MKDRWSADENISGLLGMGASTSFLSPKLVGKTCPEKGGKAVFASKAVRTGETLVVWGGEVVTWEDLSNLASSYIHLTIQIEEDLYMVSSREGPGDWINHSCNPNAGLDGQVVLVAMRDIIAGEEVCFDYAMADGSVYDEFDCKCGASNCRGRITGMDWQRSDLWERYGKYFSPYLQRRIIKLRGFDNP